MVWIELGTHIVHQLRAPPWARRNEGKHCVRGGFLIPGCYEQPCPYIVLSKPPDEDDPGHAIAFLSTTVTGYLSRDSYHCIMEPICFEVRISVSKVSARSSQDSNFG